MDRILQRLTYDEQVYRGLTTLNRESADLRSEVAYLRDSNARLTQLVALLSDNLDSVIKIQNRTLGLLEKECK
jgi:cell division protein FtsB